MSTSMSRDDWTTPDSMVYLFPDQRWPRDLIGVQTPKRQRVSGVRLILNSARAVEQQHLRIH